MMPSSLTVLVVEDNPLVRALFQKAFAPFATIVAVTTADAAIAEVGRSTPDLIISDYRLPGTDGRKLLDQLKARPDTARIPVVLAASRTDVSDRLKPVQESVEDFLEKPFFVGEAKARIKRILDKIALEKMAREAPGETQLRGSLAQMTIIDLLQTLELGRKSGGITFTRNGERCEIYFAEGQIQHAVFGDLTGDEAVYRVLTWPEGAGNFLIDFAARREERTTTRSTQGLLMEGLRLLDEANRDAAEGAEASAGVEHSEDVLDV